MEMGHVNTFRKICGAFYGQILDGFSLLPLWTKKARLKGSPSIAKVPRSTPPNQNEQIINIYICSASSGALVRVFAKQAALSAVFPRTRAVFDALVAVTTEVLSCATLYCPVYQSRRPQQNASRAHAREWLVKWARSLPPL